MLHYAFENLDVWKVSRKLVTSVYRLLQSFPSMEKYGLADQLRRAVISVPSNIAEGSGRFGAKEKLHFIEYSYGSLMEVYCQLILACDLKYIDEENLTDIKNLIDSISLMLNGMRKHQLQQLNKN